jgi:hypothetical protein
MSIARASLGVAGRARVGDEYRDEAEISSMPDGGFDTDFGRNADEGNYLNPCPAQCQLKRCADERRKCELVENGLCGSGRKLGDELCLWGMGQERRLHIF